ncbi:RagB/SusD family nutrient uptake outer membrane protein [Flavitalea flava]
MKHYHSTINSCLLIISMILAGMSCKKYIYETPISSTYDSKFWTSQQSVEQAAVALYGQLRACLRQDASYFALGDLTAGQFATTYNSYWNYNTIQPSEGSDFSYVPYLEGSLKNWTRFYQLAAQCNLILTKVPAMPLSAFSNDSTIRNRYLGEALFMRAYLYFYVTRVWGDPVYITRIYDNVDYGNIPPVARTPEADVLKACIDDLQKAAGYLPFSNGDLNKGLRANKGSIYGLMAHIYAWGHDYANAHSACQQVINNGGYSLEPMESYTNIWSEQLSPENIFSLSMTLNSNDNNFLNSGDNSSWSEAHYDFFSVWLKDSIIDYRNSNCWVANPTLYADSDQRFTTMFHQIDASGGDEAGYELLKYAGFKYNNPASKQQPLINNNLVLLRLSDIFLLDAEAQAVLGDLAGAVNSLNHTMERAGIGDYSGALTQNDLIQEILNERGRELIGEGTWFYDLIRTEPYVHNLRDVLGYSQTRVTNKGYYWPIDLNTLFQGDPLLTQNPYWTAH